MNARKRGPWDLPASPARPNLALCLLWIFNFGTLAFTWMAAPVPVLCACTAAVVITASFLHWRYRRIMEPARAVARAFALENGPLGEACRDLAEAVFLWDDKA